MIAGPDGTPYAGGLYEFDIFLPLEYPRAPPLVHLRTTGGGKVRFNPNLYESGKVVKPPCLRNFCRAEEQWQPYKSTLLQVFISIQSMILIDVPYFNECVQCWLARRLSHNLLDQEWVPPTLAISGASCIIATSTSRTRAWRLSAG
uniref:UBC core domain-containing protein n=1 Tax=Schizophyllum commune (strain H4-8 / FGSC 9210) TaxID=578458 RepID=D8PMP2_SCHCM